MSQPTILKLKVSKTGHASIMFRNFFYWNPNIFVSFARFMRICNEPEEIQEAMRRGERKKEKKEKNINNGHYVLPALT